jgi:energy-coupling factor transporter ATP-binding protein EcfA2
MAAEAEKNKKLDFEEIQIPAGPRLGNVVIEAKDLKKGFGDRVLIDGLSFTMPRGGIVGIIGPNGVGKTTLFKTIIGVEAADDGEVRIGETVKISYVDQNRTGIDPAKTVWEVVSDGLDYIQVGAQEMPSRAYIGAFGFKGPDQQKPRACCPAASATGSTWRSPSRRAATSAARRADQRPRHRDARLARERPARVPRLRRGHQPRPLVPRPHRDPHPGVGGHRRDPRSGTGSRATSSPTRPTRSSGSAPTPRVRTA